MPISRGSAPSWRQFLDLSDALLLDNSAWLSQLSTLDFLRDVGKHFTVNQMVGKESVKTRFERPDQGISYTEFSYMLLQAYDFLRLHLDHGCDLQIGGSDQWGNITLGVELVRKACGDEVWGLTTPLVLKADGTKLGKSESGNVWLSAARTSPFALVPVLSQQRRRHGRCLPALLHLPVPRGDPSARRRDGGPPRTADGTACPGTARSSPWCTARRRRPSAKRRRPRSSARRSPTSARRCCWRSPRTPPPPRSAGSRFDDGLLLVDALEQSGLAKSRSDARRTIDGRGAYVNNVQQSDVGRALGTDDLLHDRYIVLRKGPRARPRAAHRRGVRSGGARRRIVSTALVVLLGVGVASCAGEDQMGTTPHRLSVWVRQHRIR